MDITHVYGEIVKAEKTESGDLMVLGKAAGPELDLDGQRMDPAWLKTAMPRWYTFGNVRAQHSPIAAGIGMELTEGSDGWSLKALVVDKDSQQKVLKKVYKGFSVGIKGARVIKSADAPNGKIVGGEIVEISLVDRPANPTALMTVCKAAGGQIMLPTGDLGGWLAPDMRKMAAATAEDVLAGDFDLDDTDASRETIHELADLLIDQAMALKSANLDEPVDIGDLIKAANALEFFVDSDVSDYPGGEAQMQADFDEFTSKSASADVNLLVADLVKAAVAKAITPLEERNKALEAEIAKVRATPVPGGPTYVVRSAPELNKMSQADHFAKLAQRSDLSPEVKAAYAAAAIEAGGALNP